MKGLIDLGGMVNNGKGCESFSINNDDLLRYEVSAQRREVRQKSVHETGINGALNVIEKLAKGWGSLLWKIMICS